MDVTYQYTKLRCDFGRQPLFCEVGPLMCDSIPTNAAEHKSYMLRNPVHQLTQNTANFSHHYINTLSAEYTTTGANHAEGGWPRDVTAADPETTQRYRRKLEKEDNYIACIRNTAPALDHYIMQNNAIDMYQTYYEELQSVPPPERIGCRTVNVYRDPCVGGRPVSSVSWQPDSGGRFSVTYTDVDYNRNSRSSTDCYVWDVENANSPEVTITPPCALIDLQFNQRDINMLAGGLINGQVGIFDRRVGGEPSALCAPHVAHRELVRNVLFINAKSGQEFFSSSPDGAVKWWDVRNMNEYMEQMILDVVKYSFDVQSMANACGASVLEFEPTMPSRFMVGTENGYIIVGNRKGKSALEQLPAKFLAHWGPVWSLERNPAFLKNFLSVGASAARVWSDECRDSAVVWAPPARRRLTAGAWSPTRLSLMLLTQSNGVLALWDLLRKQHEPVLNVQVCEEPLLRVRMHDQGSLIACGSQKGNIYMAEVSQSLCQSDKNDKILMTLALDREAKRERILEARLREIRMKQKQLEEGGPAEAEEPDPTIELMIGDHDLAEATAYFNQLVKRELASM